MLTEKISKKELDFITSWYNPVALAEVLFDDFDNLGHFDKDKQGKIRNYQLPMLSYESIYDFDAMQKYHKLSDKDTFELRKNIADIYNFGARLFGKSLITLILDIAISSLCQKNLKSLLYSIDEKRLRGILTAVEKAMKYHPVFKLFSFICKYKPEIRFYGIKNNWELKGINMTLAGKDPGGQFYQLHVDKMWGDECCIDGHSKIRFINEKGKIETDNISYLINSKRYKNIKVLSYNFKNKKIEQKKISKIFKKQVKDYKNYKITVDVNTGKYNRNLVVSQKQKVYTDKGYKYPYQINKNDYLYLIDHCELSQVQKEILIGCLLGDGFVGNRGKNAYLSFTQGMKQKKYLAYKRECFLSLFTSYRKTKNKHKIKELKLKKFNRSVLQARSKEIPSLKEFVKFKRNKVNQRFVNIDKKLVEKYFSVISLAFWYMDDGSFEIYNCKKSTDIIEKVRLHTEGVDLKTQKYLLKLLKNKFNLNATIVKTKRGYYYLYFNKQNSKLFLDLIQDYIPPNLNYKVGKRKINFIDLSNRKYLLQKVKILSIKEQFNKSWTMYDFEVEDNHNFFANTLLISNSFETEEVYKKRRDSGSELGAIFRLAGMTNFLKHSPPGRIFFDPKNKKKVLNLPRYVNPTCSEQDIKDAEKDYGGKESLNFKIYFEGEVVEGGLSTFDMERAKGIYLKNKEIKRFELKKEQFKNFKELIVVEKPKNADRIFICADIGDGSGGSDIIILSEIGDKYYLLYNIILYNMTEEEQYCIFKYLVEQTQANILGFDCGEACGRGLYDKFERDGYKDNLVWYRGNDKVISGFEKDSNKKVKLDKKGKPIIKEEFMSEWTIKRLKLLLYAPRLFIPVKDYKFDNQFGSVIGVTSGNRTMYDCISETGDHYWSAFKVFAIAQWLKKDFNATPSMTITIGLGISSSIRKAVKRLEDKKEKQKEIIFNIQERKGIDCSKEDFENFVKILLNERANFYIFRGDIERAKIATSECHRLETKFCNIKGD